MERINGSVFQIHRTQGSTDDQEACLETTGSLSSKITLFFFYFHLVVVGILIFSLTIRGIILGSNDHHKNLLHFYPPLLTSSLLSVFIAFLFQLITLHKPIKALKTVFGLSPLLVCVMVFLLLSIGTAGCLIFAAIGFISAVIISLYSCWVTPQMEYATHIISVSLAAPVSKLTPCLAISLLVGGFYSCIVVLGLGWIARIQTRLDRVFIAIILLSLTWRMHVVRNTLFVAISRSVYTHFTSGDMALDTRVRLKDTVKHSLGSICIGSILVPVIVVFRGLARAVNMLAGNTDDFMFSCASCYVDIADRVILYGNRWGFVQVGAVGKGFVHGSIDTWKMMGQSGMISLIDSDLTGTFCFLCGVASGSFCTLVSGSWAFAVHKEFATQVSIYAFFIGYFTVRIAMSWTQASVSAYLVAYAKNPMNSQFGATIPTRILELQKSNV